MRIVIEHDSAVTTPTTRPPATPDAVEAENGGAAPQTASSDPVNADDAGGPPQWLLDALRHAAAAEGAELEITGGEATDGGPGPER